MEEAEYYPGAAGWAHKMGRSVGRKMDVLPAGVVSQGSKSYIAIIYHRSHVRTLQSISFF